MRGSLGDPYGKSGSVVFCYHRRSFFPDQLKNIMPIIRNHTALDNRTAIEQKREQKNSGEIIKQVS